ncbi:TetR/AcrR family transcriptional regulator [Oricola sp.]|uniref:TetR/AcrR family transcriptional regulator n=1 Tax=Oricola sp. TaxID=1979950 RepID=UPI003BAC9218
MADSYAARRRAAIKEAAFEVLAEKGYKAASMLEIARRAKASNETLYKWFGNKQTLFGALVEDNAKEARELLQSALAEDHDPLDALTRLGPVLIGIVCGEKAVALNRAAAGDVFETGTLGKTIAQHGRNAILPLLTNLFAAAARAGKMTVTDPQEAADTYINLLIGDLQIRRAIGVTPIPGESEAATRSARAVAAMRVLHAA